MEIILIFIWAGVLISLLCDRRIRKITEEVMDYGTKGQTGEQAVRLFLKEMGGKMKIKYDFHSMFDYYDIKSETLNICSLSKNSSSLYFYCNALRQSAFGIRAQKKKKLYALKTAFLMLLRISGPVMLVLLLAGILLRNRMWITAAGIEILIFLGYQLLNTGIEMTITKEAMMFIKSHDSLGKKEEKEAERFYRSIEFAEWAVLRKGIRSILSLILKLPGCLLRKRGGEPIKSTER